VEEALHDYQDRWEGALERGTLSTITAFIPKAIAELVKARDIATVHIQEKWDNMRIHCIRWNKVFVELEVLNLVQGAFASFLPFLRDACEALESFPEQHRTLMRVKQKWRNACGVMSERQDSLEEEREDLHQRIHEWRENRLLHAVAVDTTTHIIGVLRHIQSDLEQHQHASIQGEASWMDVAKLQLDGLPNGDTIAQVVQADNDMFNESALSCVGIINQYTTLLQDLEECISTCLPRDRLHIAPNFASKQEKLVQLIPQSQRHVHLDSSVLHPLVDWIGSLSSFTSEARMGSTNATFNWIKEISSLTNTAPAYTGKYTAEWCIQHVPVWIGGAKWTRTHQ
jgi:hypothetical protein